MLSFSIMCLKSNLLEMRKESTKWYFGIMFYIVLGSFSRLLNVQLGAIWRKELVMEN